MRLPNGYGSVYKLSGNRRNPWAVRITCGWDVDMQNSRAKQKYKFVGYYPTRKEALSALAEYNQNSYDIDISKITLKEIYDKWSAEFFPTASKSNIKGLKTAWKICENAKLDKMCLIDIKLIHLQNAMDQSGKNAPILKKMKILLSHLYTYAIIHDYITPDRNKITYLQINAGNPNKIHRSIFTSQEIEQLWRAEPSNPYYSVILILIYTGLRIGELLDLKKENVNLEEQSFKVTASKTQAGIRTVPIADKVLPLFEKWYHNSDSKYLITKKDVTHISYSSYKKIYWKPLLDHLNMKHLPHDTRHTCISMLAAAGVDEKITKKIVGHSGQGITESVYTHFNIQELLDAINRI